MIELSSRGDIYHLKRVDLFKTNYISIKLFSSNHILPSVGFLTRYILVYHDPSVVGGVTVIFCSK